MSPVLTQMSRSIAFLFFELVFLFIYSYVHTLFSIGNLLISVTSQRRKWLGRPMCTIFPDFLPSSLVTEFMIQLIETVKDMLYSPWKDIAEASHWEKWLGKIKTNHLHQSVIKKFQSTFLILHNFYNLGKTAFCYFPLLKLCFLLSISFS
jgi:hypothetical protein